MCVSCVGEEKYTGTVCSISTKASPSLTKQQPEISSYIDMIQNRLHILEKSLSVLREKIEPVLNNKPTQNTKEAEVMCSPTTQLGTRLFELYSHTRMLQNMLEDITNSIEL